MLQNCGCDIAGMIGLVRVTYAYSSLPSKIRRSFVVPMCAAPSNAFVWTS